MSLDIRAKFMMVVAVTFFIYSVFWALAPYPTINLPARLILDLANWPLDSLETPLDRNTRWLSAIGSGVLAAISIFLGGIVVPAIKNADTSITRTTILAMIVWYVIDSTGSVASGVSSNVFFNSIYLGLVLIPLIGINSDDEIKD